MGFLGFGKKKSVPDELPDLISDEIEKESAMEINSALRETPLQEASQIQPTPVVQSVPTQVIEPRPLQVQKPTQEEINRNRDVVDRLVRGVESTQERPLPTTKVFDKSYFENMKSDLMSEIKDLNSIEKWYEKNLSNSSVIDEMKTFWNKQKEIESLDVLADDFQKKISVKVHELQNVEKEWQSIYFELIDREEKIREAEKELRELLTDFVSVCKQKKKSLTESEKSVETKARPKKKKKKKSSSVKK